MDKITFQSDPRSLAIIVVIGILLTPAIGIGLLLIWLSYEKYNHTFYDLSDSELVIRERSSSYSLQTDSIINVEWYQSMVDGIFKMHSVKVYTHKRIIDIKSVPAEHLQPLSTFLGSSPAL